MVAEGAPPAPRAGEPAILALGEADAAEMAALADHAKPGPWGPATHRYGPFFGIREEGRLLAMAGQRIQRRRSEEHTSELQSLMRISYAVFCLNKKTVKTDEHTSATNTPTAPTRTHTH